MLRNELLRQEGATFIARVLKCVDKTAICELRVEFISKKRF